MTICADVYAAGKICSIARNFENLDPRGVEGGSSRIRNLLQTLRSRKTSGKTATEASPLLGGAAPERMTIHVWPLATAGDDSFESCTTILQLASILSNTEGWDSAEVEVFALAETEEDALAEVARLRKLLDGLRIEAAVRAAVASKSPIYRKVAEEHLDLDGTETSSDHQSDGFATSTLGRFSTFSLEEQCLILRDMIKECSGEASIIFSTFPPPKATSKDANASDLYMQSLDDLSDIDVPILLTASPSLVVTMSI